MSVPKTTTLTPAGKLDPGYRRGGRKLVDVGGPDDVFFGVAVSADGSRDDGAVPWLQP